jgi:hypothetical protein
MEWESKNWDQEIVKSKELGKTLGKYSVGRSRKHGE